MHNIFTYTNYREFLADYYEQMKAASQSFSYQNFSRKAGFTSKSFVFNVIKGRKNLSPASAVQIAEAIGLSSSEAQYFEILVSFNQAQDVRGRTFFYNKLNAVNARTPESSDAKRLRQDQYDFYSRWYNVVIRSLIDLIDIRDDYALLARLVHPPISTHQAKESILLLERLGLVKRDARGIFRVTSATLTTGKDVQSLAVQHFHAEAMKLADQALKTLPRDARNISGLTLGISPETYRNVCDAIYECQEKIMIMVEKDRGANRVFQLNFHLFPVSKPVTERSDG